MLGRSAGISVLASHAPLQYRKKSSPGFTAGSMLPTTTPCDSSAACQPTTSAHAAAANHTPLLTTRTLFSKILICPLSLLSFLSRHHPDTHTHPLLNVKSPKRVARALHKIPFALQDKVSVPCWRDARRGRTFRFALVAVA